MNKLLILILLVTTAHARQIIEVQAGESYQWDIKATDTADDNSVVVTVNDPRFTIEKIDICSKDGELQSCVYRLTYYFKRSEVGDKRVTIKATDSEGLSDTEVITFKVKKAVNKAPKLGKLAAVVASE